MPGTSAADELHPQLARASARYLRLADTALPGRVVGCYLAGSSALGAFRPGRSDIDLLVVVDGRLSRRELRRTRVVQWVSGACTSPGGLRAGGLSAPGTCNATYVDAADLDRPVSEIVPLASHTGVSFAAGAGFDVNPVVWKVLAESGIALRGPHPADLDLDPEPDRLRQWNAENLERYWRWWGERVVAGRRASSPFAPSRWLTAWGVLGAPRLHRTIATGDVVSKEAAGEWALATYDECWHPIIREGLAYWRGDAADPAFAKRSRRLEVTGRFVLEVVSAATAPPGV